MKSELEAIISLLLEKEKKQIHRIKIFNFTEINWTLYYIENKSGFMT